MSDDDLRALNRELGNVALAIVAGATQEAHAKLIALRDALSAHLDRPPHANQP
jgi:hypothetical protein